MISITEFFNKHYVSIFFVVFLLFFVGTHLSGIHSPYHQDEYKWVYYSHPEIIPPGTVPHPPLTEFIYTTFGPLLGDNNFRFIPFFFGTLNLFLVFYLTKIIFDRKVALLATFLFAISFYSLLASLMVDVDGAVMPFFFLIMLIGYEQLKKRNFQFSIFNFQSLMPVILLVFGALGGFLVKVVFAIPIAVLAFNFALEKHIFSDKKKIFKFISYSILGVIILSLVLILSKFVFPSFNLSYSFKYWQHFATFGYRNWFQTFIQFAKSILYLSPLLLTPLLFINKEIFKKTRPLLILLVTLNIFYLFVFDFSTGALDRYFQFMIIPLCIISSAILVSVFRSSENKRNKKYLLFGILIAIVLLAMVFVSHYVPSLHPKKEWITRFLSLRWNFLYPFSGGSGPLGFYVSFLFIALSWIISVSIMILGLIKPHLRKMAVLILIPIGIMYNFVFIEEYLFGKINGSAPTLLYDAVEFIKNNQDIKSVTVYNDNGAYSIQSIGKYKRRMYVEPRFTGYREYLNANKNYYFVLDVPKIDPASFFAEYFNSCLPVYQKTDRKINATVFDCKNAINVKLD